MLWDHCLSLSMPVFSPVLRVLNCLCLGSELDRVTASQYPCGWDLLTCSLAHLLTNCLLRWAPVMSFVFNYVFSSHCSPAFIFSHRGIQSGFYHHTDVWKSGSRSWPILRYGGEDSWSSLRSWIHADGQSSPFSRRRDTETRGCV